VVGSLPNGCALLPPLTNYFCSTTIPDPNLGDEWFQRVAVRYPVLFPAASYDHVVLREAIGTEGVERFREDVTTIRLDGIEQRLAVDPAKPFKKVQ
jgi:hypothetical protein